MKIIYLIACFILNFFSQIYTTSFNSFKFKLTRDIGFGDWKHGYFTPNIIFKYGKIVKILQGKFSPPKRTTGYPNGFEFELNEVLYQSNILFHLDKNIYYLPYRFM